MPRRIPVFSNRHVLGMGQHAPETQPCQLHHLIVTNEVHGIVRPQPNHEPKF